MSWRPRARGRTLGWLALFVWALALSALTALLGRGGGGAFVPDPALVLVVLVLGRSEPADLAPLALVLALARGATAGDPPLAILAASALALLLVLALRGALELSTPHGRAVGAGVAAFALHAWLAIVHAARTANAGESLFASLGVALGVALASALLALVAGPLLAHLPGLTPLRSRTW